MTFERLFANQLADLGQVTEAAIEFLKKNGINARVQYAVNLAIEEMGTNILKYGYDDQNAHTIRLKLDLADGKAILVLEDDGHEFDPLQAPAPDLNLKLDDRKPGGLGICLVRQFVDDIRYERREGRNLLTVTIGCEGTDRPGGC
jgi:serine/threonine-protein kinase RsbW